MERATKLIVLLWACAALAFEVHLVARGWIGLQPIAFVTFVAAVALTAFSRKAVALVLIFAYVFPALIRTVHGDYNIYYGALWMSGLLGALMPDAVRTTWHIPNRFRGALICWALVVAVGTPIVVLRELDFNLGLFDWSGPVWSSVAGGFSPSNAAPWITYVGLVPVLGILWFDWLLATSEDDFHRWVAMPLLASAGLMATVAIYQMFVDNLFLNETSFGVLHRASGTLFDANLCGTVAALWAAGAVGLGQTLKRFRTPVTVCGTGIAWLAVWGSGSRTAFACALLATGCAFAAAAFGWWRSGRRAAVGFAAAALCVAGTALVGTSSRTMGPLTRLPSFALNYEALRAELWDRNGYGVIATATARDFPWFGVGVGSFPIVMPDYAMRFVSNGQLGSDNAQNWYRQQVVENGVLGSLAWIVWAVGLAIAVVWSRPAHRNAIGAWAIGGALFGFALISFVGVPAQDITVAITFWTFAFWFLRVSGAPQVKTRLGGLQWMAILAIVCVFAAGTAAFATGRLRVANRAIAGGWHYSYGFYDPEPDGAGGEYRWAARRAATLLPVSPDARWLFIRLNTNHVDIAEKPVDVKVWVDGRIVLDSRLENTLPLTQYVLIGRNVTRTLLETWTSRVIRPSDFGVADDRELGIMISWSFVDAPPEEIRGTGVQ